MRIHRQTNPRVDAEFEYVDQRVTVLEADKVPVGTLLLYGGTVAPDGYLLCDGATYSIRQYPELFSVLERRGGTPSPDNGNNFALPSFTNNGLSYIIKAVP